MITISAVLKNSFRNIKLVGLLLASIGVQGCSDRAGAESQKDSPSPEKVFQLFGGEEHRFEDIKAPFVLMNYWASWCKPCVKEIPELNALNENLNTAVYAYNFDQLEGDALLAEADKFQLKLPMMLNEPAPMFNEKPPAALPATLVVNTQTGKQQWLMGAQTKQGILAALNMEK
jgi:thiol-disulfide isomerase/thioredoxin